jgi:hypothetical protein
MMALPLHEWGCSAHPCVCVKVDLLTARLCTQIVVLKLVVSCRWNCGLGKLSTILEMKFCVGNCTRSCLEFHLYKYICSIYAPSIIPHLLSYHYGHQLHPRKP